MTGESRENPNRRQLLTLLAASPIALMGVGAFTSSARAEAQAAGLISANVCMVQKQTTEGPYYLDPALVRREITEGRPGVPIRLNLQVVGADCRPVEGARVDVWHCDAEGNYSGYARQGSDGMLDTSGETFLRGTQMSGRDGVARFRSIYPGWYRGRTPHIHYKVWLDDRSVLTSQIFFPDALTAYLFRTEAPYAARAAGRDTTNARDRIARAAGEGAYAQIREQPGFYDVSLVAGVAVL